MAEDFPGAVTNSDWVVTERCVHKGVRERDGYELHSWKQSIWERGWRRAAEENFWDLVSDSAAFILHFGQMERSSCSS